MRGRVAAAAGVSALALLVAACSGGAGSSNGSGTSSAPPGGEIVVNGCEPQGPLVAGDTAEVCGGNVLSTLTSQLVHYDSVTAEPENDIAESITTDDNQHFTVTLRPGYTFSDGTEVKARNFVDAWNYTGYAPNGQRNSHFFAPIEGYADLQCPEPDCVEDPKATRMSGLEVVDDHTFTITTTEKVANLPVRLGYTGFAPQPDSFFEDPQAFGKNPVGAGPFMFDHWTRSEEIVVMRNPSYSGDWPGRLDRITFRIFQDLDAAYNDLLGGGLDVLDLLPQSALVDDQYTRDLPDRSARRESSNFTYLGFRLSDPDVSDPDVRRAISMAIDRNAIIDRIFDGAFTPAASWASPVVDGYQPGACGEYCEFDAAAARSLLERAGGFPGDTLTMSYNSDGGHKPMAEAVCNSVEQALGIDCVATPVVDFSTFLTKLGDGEIDGMWRLGWIMDYPSIENYLAPVYGKDAGANFFGYESEAFDDLLARAARAPSVDEANTLYQAAERRLAGDFPSIPLWFRTTTVGWSHRVADVAITAFGVPDYARITVQQEAG